MFKIVTDPTVYPVREVDLTAAAGGLTLTPRATGRNRDLLWERSDGGLNVARRARRVDLTLEASVLEGHQTEALQEVLGMTRGGAARVPGYLFPPFDASTLVSLPLQRSLKGWRRDVPNGTLESVSASFGRASAGFYTDPWGRFLQVAAGVPRYTVGPLGRALQVEKSTTNLVTTPHPTAGTLVWTPTTGSPAVEWATDQRSPYWEAGGAVRVRRAAVGGCTVTSAPAGTCSASSANRFCYSVWVKGNARGTVQVIIGGQVALSGTLVAYPDRWTRWSLDFARSNAITSFSVLLSFLDDGSDRVVFLGPHQAVEYPNDGTRWPLSHWTNVPTAKDDPGITVANTPGALSFSVASRIPPRPVRSRYWFLGGGGGDPLGLQWIDSGGSDVLQFNNGANNVELVPPTAEWDAAVGRPCVATVRMGRNVAGTGWTSSVDVAYTLADHGPVRRWSTAQDVQTGDYSRETDLTLGSFDAWEPGELGLSWLRYDGRTWTDLQLQTWERCILESGFRDVFGLVQGRQFLLGDLELESIPGTSYQRATLTAQETNADEDLAVLV